MAQTKTLNVIPNDFITQIDVSQGDIGRVFYINLYEGSVAYAPTSGDVITCEGTKPSGLGFTVECTYTDNVVTVTTTEAMTDESGRINTQLVITNGDTVIGTSDFILDVKKNPHPDDTTDGTQTTADSLQVQITALDTRITELESLTVEVSGEALVITTGGNS